MLKALIIYSVFACSLFTIVYIRNPFLNNSGINPNWDIIYSTLHHYKLVWYKNLATFFSYTEFIFHSLTKGCRFINAATNDLIIPSNIIISRVGRPVRGNRFLTG
ncbi:hypothetical protein BpHYR1_039865 [Brachionus plicatilis]|uniref:Uncharacterized protein n=1 Tax=Brachionus plicatilis TaxID=10195 RepID=A0A3M7RJS6_BRAPC|nr:hypothetical protein BpHYR1_039865 [Brachionus plicatilis]